MVEHRVVRGGRWFNSTGHRIMEKELYKPSVRKNQRQYRSDVKRGVTPRLSIAPPLGYSKLFFKTCLQSPNKLLRTAKVIESPERAELSTVIIKGWVTIQVVIPDERCRPYYRNYIHNTGCDCSIQYSAEGLVMCLNSCRYTTVLSEIGGSSESSLCCGRYRWLGFTYRQVLENDWGNGYMQPPLLK